MRIKPALHIREQFDLITRLRIGDANLYQKTIKLRLGQRICALEVDGILSGKHGEEGGKIVARSIDRDLALLHAFQKSGLGAGRHAVDFVNQQQLGENRARVQLKSAAGKIEYVGANDVRWHQVRGALYSLKIEA